MRGPIYSQFLKKSLFIKLKLSFQALTKLPEELKLLWAKHAHRKMKKLYVLPHNLRFSEKLEFIKEFKTFTFVRHPFIRLVSTFRDQSFTSLLANLCQDLNRVSAFRRCLNGTFP